MKKYWLLDNNNKVIDLLTEHSIFKDGGTQSFKGKSGKTYFLDGRISSKTKNQLYDKYPTDKNANLLKGYTLTNVKPSSTKIYTQKEVDKLVAEAYEKGKKDRAEYDADLKRWERTDIELLNDMKNGLSFGMK
jgi:hypothetical protein